MFQHTRMAYRTHLFCNLLLFLCQFRKSDVPIPPTHPPPLVVRAVLALAVHSLLAFPHLLFGFLRVMLAHHWSWRIRLEPLVVTIPCAKLLAPRYPARIGLELFATLRALYSYHNTHVS